MNGTCKLCRKNGELARSHIIPDFYIRSLEHKKAAGTKGELKPFSTLLSTRHEITGGAKQRGYWEKVVGMKEYLLCFACEQKFQRNEVYVRELLYGNTPQPLRKIPIGKLARHEQDGEVLQIRRVTVDYRKFKLFQMSVLWRAGVAQGSFFENVRLGEYHEDRLRHLLHAEDPSMHTEYACLMVDLQHDRQFEDWIEQPTKKKKAGQANYQFIMGGYLYLFTVSSQKPRIGVQECCVKPTGEMIILVEDEGRILRNWAVALRKAGKL